MRRLNMFDKYLCKNIDKKHITVGDAIWRFLPEILGYITGAAMVISFIAVTILSFGPKIAVFIFVGMTAIISISIFVCNKEIATCPNMEEDE